MSEFEQIMEAIDGMRERLRAIEIRLTERDALDAETAERNTNE